MSSTSKKYRICAKAITVVLLLLNSPATIAQTEVPFLKEQASILAAPGMYGRGYINGGGDKAAQYIRDQFGKFGLKSFKGTDAYYQSYHFPVNVFPGVVSLKLNHKRLQPGKDFLVHPASSSISIRNKKLQTINLAGVKDSIAWEKLERQFDPQYAYLLKNIDTFIQHGNLSIRKLANLFTKGGVFLLPQSKKLIWLATTDTVKSTIFMVKDSSMPKKIREVSAQVENQFVPDFSTQNILGYVPGTQRPDSFIVFAAHYDHLGEMGKGTIFPGASDNASGVAVLLSLARYYAAHPAKYSIAFMSFSGEEAGLIGSGYYVTSPVFPLRRIRFLVNLDIIGDATRGITVVNGNAPETADQYALLEKINREHGYLPSLTARDQAKNSDHYPFSEKEIPAVYIYTNGVKPWYHDINDRPEELGFEQVDGVLALLKEFVKKF